MSSKINPVAFGFFDVLRSAVSKIAENKKAVWAIQYAARWVLVALAIVAYTVVVARIGQKRAMEEYETWKVAYVAEMQQRSMAMAYTDAESEYATQLDAEAESLARVLYGIKDNSPEDLRTYCWCVFNRVDNRDYPDTLEAVISQPEQWMRYSEENPVIESLYQIAKEQLDAWHTGSRRPVSSDYVYMNWSPSDLSLRDNWQEGSRTHYWRYTG